MSIAAIDLLLSNPVRFVPPGGPDALWPAVPEWTPDDWAHWLREHNKYSYLKSWSEEEIHQYVQIDRNRYGFGLTQKKGGAMHYFYNPTPIAVPFHASKTRNILFGGAAGGSKSHSARWDALRHCPVIPDFKAIIMRRTMEELRRNHLANVRKECRELNAFLGREVFQYYTDKEVRVCGLHGGADESIIIFGHCQHEGDEEIYLGDAYDAFYPDEMATFTKKQIIGVAGRLRSVTRYAPWVKQWIKVRARLAGTSNPGGAHTLWLKEHFIDKLEAEIQKSNPKYRASNYTFIQAMLYDNPYYMDEDGTYDTYEERLFAYDPERRAQLLLGDWSALSGQFFPEFSDKVHVANLPIPPGCKIERWIDWGYTPHYGMCLWVASLPSGRLYVFAEWKFNGETARQKLVASEVADNIHRLTQTDIFPMVRSNRITKSIADPSMWNSDGHGQGEDLAETFAKHKVRLVKADHDRVMGWGRLRHWFRNAPDGMPWLMIHPRCVTTIRTIPGLVRDEKDLDDLDTKGEDHPADALRYGVMARPTPTKIYGADEIVLPDSVRAIMSEALGSAERLAGMVS